MFLYHWKEESQHAVIDELEWRREDAKVSNEARDQAVTDLIDLVGAVDGILQGQADADADYFVTAIECDLNASKAQEVKDVILEAYRWQYIVSGVKDGRFLNVLTELIDDGQAQRVTEALGPLT